MARPTSQNPAPAPAATEAATTARQGGAGYTLAQLIERWHAANPHFNEITPPADPDTLIVLRNSRIDMDYRRKLEHRIAIGAACLDISTSEYRRRIDAGEKHCGGCRTWHPRTEFGKRTATVDGLDYVCKAFSRERGKAYQRRKRRAS